MLARHYVRLDIGLISIVLIFVANVSFAEPLRPIPRRLPPAGIKLDPRVRNQLLSRLAEVREQLTPVLIDPLAPDVVIFLDAVRLAIRHNEFYRNTDAQRAFDLLDKAAERVESLRRSKSPWTTSRGLLVRGYVSSIDGSVQPYGLVVPQRLDLSKPAPLYVWLHGRGDKTTNTAFLHQRMTRPGKVVLDDAIVVHPWGRHCVGYKSAGEIDVLEAVEHVCTQYKIDRRRIVLMGFSMGGAGCWHLGAHYPDRWVAMSPGAGFAETALYQNIDPNDVPSYERQLWGTYDVPNYVRNLFNLPVVAYSGEKDRQIQAARVMESAFTRQDRKLNHLIGPGMGHKYHPDTLATILRKMKAARDRGLDPSPSRVWLQTRTLRYHRVHWVDVQGLGEHWRDARVDAHRPADGKIELSTRNVTALSLSPSKLPDRIEVTIDGQMFKVALGEDGQSGQRAVRLAKRNGRWALGATDPKLLTKRPGLQGPIDDAYLAPFLVVLPSGKCQHAAVQRWVEFEQARFLDRWQALFRGKPRIKLDKDVTAKDAARYHLVLWGDPKANRVLGRIADRLPIKWGRESIAAGDEKKYKSAGHALLMIYPNPEAPARYVVLNSGPTFREGHDRTNSLQNPKLPDWAVVDLSKPPDATSPGRVAAADFFDETWKLRTGR